MTAVVSHLAGPFLDLVEVATLADVPCLAELGEQLHAASDHRVLAFNREKVERTLTHLITDPNGVVFVSRRDGVIVGAFAGAVAPHWFSDDLVGLDFAFFVEPDARGASRGTTLILAFKRWCERRGARLVKVSIAAGIEVESASRLVRSLGFVDAGVGFMKEVGDGA